MNAPDTTTELLKIHEREKQVRPRRQVNRALLSALELAVTLSAERDREEKPAVVRIRGLTKIDMRQFLPGFKVVRVDLKKHSPAPRGGLMHLLKHGRK